MRDSGFLTEKLKQSKIKMAEIKIHKTNEKVLIWLHRESKTQQWLAVEMGQTRQGLSNKIADNSFTVGDTITLKRLGVLTD